MSIPRGVQGIVPVAMEGVAPEDQGRHLCLRHLHAGRIGVRVQGGVDLQPSGRAGVADQLHMGIFLYSRRISL